MTKDVQEIINHKEISFHYQMLSRFQMDCDYFIGWGTRNPSQLWACNVVDHIQNMKDLWLSFPEDGKPEWLTFEDILEYERKMTETTMTSYKCPPCGGHFESFPRYDSHGEFARCEQCNKIFATGNKEDAPESSCLLCC